MQDPFNATLEHIQAQNNTKNKNQTNNSNQPNNPTPQQESHEPSLQTQKSLLSLYSMQSTFLASLKKNLNKVESFLTVLWILNFIIAFHDQSTFMTATDLGIGIGFTFKTWNICDGVLTVCYVFVLAAVRVVLGQYGRAGVLRQVVYGHPCKFFMAAVFTVAKLVWIGIGLAFFTKLKFSQTSKLLTDFLTVYFVGFLGGSFYVIQSLILNKIVRSALLEYEQVNKILDLKVYIKNLKKNPEHSATSKNKNKNEIEKSLKESNKQIEFVFSIMWIVNLILYLKDDSQCIDSPETGLPLTFRTWHLISAITVLVSSLLSLPFLALTARHELTLPQKCPLLFYIFWVGVAAVQLFFFAWFVVGMVVFFRLQARECSEQVLQFSVVYFVGFLVVAATVGFRAMFY